MWNKIESLLQFALNKQMIEPEDLIWARNQLLAYLKISAGDVDMTRFGKTDPSYDNCENAVCIIEALIDDYASRGLMSDDSASARDRMEAGLMNLLMPRPSELTAAFWEKYANSKTSATDYFYNLCKASNYIQMERLKKNIKWLASTKYGDLEITINLSKPEKDPRDIAAARMERTSSYPKCLLCAENVGFEGTSSKPARQNLRTVPITLDNENWYLQYSPYLYYNEHCIVFNQLHTPMRLTDRTFYKLIGFLKDFPHYFVGSNADLPIVGGSILSHDHFQGGRHTFPLDNAEVYAEYRHPKYPDVSIGQVAWPLSVIRLTLTESADESKLANLAFYILECWRKYSDPEAEIYAFTGDTPHNTITPIARRKNGRLEMDLVLRNNRTTDEYPFGLFHPHPEWHHIKKENIGLIEVMGLAILPGRLHSVLEAKELSRQEIERVFLNVLIDCGVFKDTDTGRKQFRRFIEYFV